MILLDPTTGRRVSVDLTLRHPTPCRAVRPAGPAIADSAAVGRPETPAGPRRHPGLPLQPTTT